MEEFDKMSEQQKQKLIDDYKKVLKSFSVFCESLDAASKGISRFHVEFYKSLSEKYQQLKLVAIPDDLTENIDYFYNLPEEYDEQFIRAVTQGLSLKEAFELLKETYNF